MWQRALQIPANWLSSTLNFVVENPVFLENNAVVNAVQPPRRGNEIAPRAAAFAKPGNEVLRFNQLVFQKADENQPVERALGDFGKRFAVELWDCCF